MGGGNPITPVVPSGGTEHPLQMEGPAEEGKPALAWRLIEPAELLDEDWGHMPATIATSITFSAELYGTRADEFKGEIYFSVDGKEYPFKFDNYIFTSEITDLQTGIHNLHLLAASAMGEAARVFDFEVLAKPPSMQLGFGIDDGKLYVSLPRPMPSAQLGDISRWTVDGFDSDKQKVEVLAGNDMVVIELGKDVLLDDLDLLAKDGFNPKVLLNSSLGVMEAPMFPNRLGQALDDRSGQVYGCQKGTVYPLGSCNAAGDWNVDRKHLTSLGMEAREILDAEAPIGFYGCQWGGGEPWSSCFLYVVSRFNWYLEGHLDPWTNWDAQYDTVEYCSYYGCQGYNGIGYTYGHWEHYGRDRGYFLPSTCPYMWEVRVDCNNCDSTEPYGYQSKGHRIGVNNMPDGEGFPVDDACPVFDEIKIIPGEELNEYVQNTLIPDVQGLGNEYAADSYWGSNLWGYYWSRCGQYMDQWLNQFPGGLCIVVKAHDFESELFGQWINSYLSIDSTDSEGGNHILEDCQLHYFYVDKAPYAVNEHTTENWPRGANCNSPLPTDGLKNGEYSVWIIRPEIGCAWLDWQSCRLRIKDDCHNWTRSENLTSGGDFELTITQPPDESELPYESQVTFHAEFPEGGLNDWIEEYIKWSIQIYENGNWVDYGPHESGEYQDWDSKIESIISHNIDDWTGSDFVIQSFQDCTLKVRARICGSYYDTCTIYVEGSRSGQSTPPYQINEIGIIVNDEHNADPDNEYLLVTSDNEISGNWNSAPVIARHNGVCQIDYAVQVLTLNPCVQAPDYIDTFVEAPLDDCPDSISVRLFPVTPERNSFLDTLFGGAPPGQQAFYYDAGDNKVTIKNSGQSVSWDNPMGWPPQLYLSDQPTLVKDYVICNSYASINHYHNINKDLYYGDYEKINNVRVNQRGVLYGDEINGNPKDPKYFGDLDKKELPCFVTDVMKWGFEVVQVKLANETDSAQIGVQSRGQIVFAPAHGAVWNQDIPPPTRPPDYFENQAARDLHNNEHDNWYQDTAKCMGIGPYYKGELEGVSHAHYIQPSTLNSNDYLEGVNWIVATSCELLNHNSWKDWRESVSLTPISSICGFCSGTTSSFPDNFWSDFSENLSQGDNNNPCQINITYWATTAFPDDHCIIVWMQNACEKARIVDGGFGSLRPVIFASAVDDHRMYYLYKGYFFRFSLDAFYLQYYIYSIEN